MNASEICFKFWHVTLIIYKKAIVACAPSYYRSYPYPLWYRVSTMLSKVSVLQSRPSWYRLISRDYSTQL